MEDEGLNDYNICLFIGQDEKNQLMTTNVWMKQVKDDLIWLIQNKLFFFYYQLPLFCSFLVVFSHTNTHTPHTHCFLYCFVWESALEIKPRLSAFRSGQTWSSDGIRIITWASPPSEFPQTPSGFLTLCFMTSMWCNLLPAIRVRKETSQEEMFRIIFLYIKSGIM